MKKALLGLLTSCLLLGSSMTVCAETPEVNTSEAASVVSTKIAVPKNASTDYAAAMEDLCYVDTPKIVGFFDAQGRYNVAYNEPVSGLGNLVVKRYDTASMELVDSITLAGKCELFGNVTCDKNGNYYVVWGDMDWQNQDIITLRVSKYNESGALVGECALKGSESKKVYVEKSGTRYPFYRGNCSITVNDAGIVACNLGRQMYNDSFSNCELYIDSNTMTRIDDFNAMVSYASDSSDQRIIALKDGNFLSANLGTAYPRAFLLRYVLPESQSDELDKYALETFHFREGANRSMGHVETYAQLGSIAESENAFVFCGSSERTLSLASAPTNDPNMVNGHSEARDLFVQFLKKDFYKSTYGDANKYYLTGETRVPTGTKNSSASNLFFLTGEEKDYGVIWLTDYADEYYVNNPKMLVTDDNKIVVMWEKLSYSTHTGQTYYMILNEDGSINQPEVEIKNVKLSGSVDPVYKDGKIYWVTSVRRNTAGYIHCLSIKTESNPIQKNPFSDVPEDAWYYQFVKYAYDNGMMSGIDKDANDLVVFQPLANIPREQFVTVLYALEGKPNMTTGKNFTDMVAGQYYEKPIWWAASTGVTVGYNDGTFGVGKEITRQELVVMLKKYAENKGYDTSGRAVLDTYPDVDTVGDWAKDAMSWAVSNGMISGKAGQNGEGNILAPEGNATRAECATILKNFREKYVK